MGCRWLKSHHRAFQRRVRRVQAYKLELQRKILQALGQPEVSPSRRQ